MSVLTTELVSIIVPTHNRLDLLPRALASALNQTHKNIEVIVIDDGSKDGTLEFLNSHTDSRVKFIHNPTAKGACHARNSGINIAQGKYITFLDDDDEYLPRRLEKMLEAYKEQMAYVASALIYIHQNGRKEILNHGRNVTAADMLLRIVTGNTILTETKKIRELGGFDINLSSSQDYDLWLRLNLTYGDAVYITEPLFVMHTEHESPRITLSSKKFKGHWTFYNKHKKSFNRQQRAYQLFELLRCRNKKIKLWTALRLTYQTFPIRGLRHYLAVSTPVLRRAYFKLTSK